MSSRRARNTKNRGEFRRPRVRLCSSHLTKPMARNQARRARFAQANKELLASGGSSAWPMPNLCLVGAPPRRPLEGAENSVTPWAPAKLTSPTPIIDEHLSCVCWCQWEQYRAVVVATSPQGCLRGRSAQLLGPHIPAGFRGQRFTFD